MMHRTFFLLVLVAAISGCNDPEGLGNPSTISGDWSIPSDKVFDGGPGRDGIPAVDNPQLISISEATFLTDDELIIGYADESSAVAYPHQILDWHEIINHEVNEVPFAVTYCPLTGTAIGWDRIVDGKKTTFGVSGLLYNSNLIPFDRSTSSNWSQMLSETVNGALIGTNVRQIALVETTWKTWKEMYPETQVVSRNTGHNRSYGVYPYGDYRTNNRLIFPVTNDDGRLNRKERVHGVVINNNVKTYRFADFAELNLIEDNFNGKDIIIVGDKERNFIVSFDAKLTNGEKLEFEAFDGSAGSSVENAVNAVILKDTEGNQWNVFGYAVSGPRTGERLVPTKSFIGYWFSWGAFYPDLEIYNF